MMNARRLRNVCTKSVKSGKSRAKMKKYYSVLQFLIPIIIVPVQEVETYALHIILFQDEPEQPS